MGNGTFYLHSSQVAQQNHDYAEQRVQIIGRVGYIL